VEEAVTHFRKAVELDPSDEKSKKNLEKIEDLRSRFF